MGQTFTHVYGPCSCSWVGCLEFVTHMYPISLQTWSYYVIDWLIPHWLVSWFLGDILIWLNGKVIKKEGIIIFYLAWRGKIEVDAKLISMLFLLNGNKSILIERDGSHGAICVRNIGVICICGHDSFMGIINTLVIMDRPYFVLLLSY